MLAEHCFGGDDTITRIDCSELMERHSISKLVGSPPGAQAPLLSMCFPNVTTAQDLPSKAATAIRILRVSVFPAANLVVVKLIVPIHDLESELPVPIAGFMGYGEGGGLTEAVRRRPAGLVLFDEVEKVRGTLAASAVFLHTKMLRTHHSITCCCAAAVLQSTAAAEGLLRHAAAGAPGCAECAAADSGGRPPH